MRWLDRRDTERAVIEPHLSADVRGKERVVDQWVLSKIF